MATLTVYANADDQTIASGDADRYSSPVWTEVTSATGSDGTSGHGASLTETVIGSWYFTDTPWYEGDDGDGYPIYSYLQHYVAYQIPMRFDTSALGSGSTVSDAVMAMYLLGNYSDADDTLKAWLYSWTAPSGGSNYRTATWLSTATRLATYATSGLSGAAYYSWTSDAAFATNVNKTGDTTLVCAAARHESGGTAPSGRSYVYWKSADASGTANDPKLTITYTEGGGTTYATQLFQTRTIQQGVMRFG